MKYEEVEVKVIKWGHDKGILLSPNPQAQLLKSVEELGEVVKAELKEDREGITDGIGDTVVTLILYATMKGLNLVDCLEIAYNEIADRSGKMVNGSFVKDSKIN